MIVYSDIGLSPRWIEGPWSAWDRPPVCVSPALRGPGKARPAIAQEYLGDLDRQLGDLAALKLTGGIPSG